MQPLKMVRRFGRPVGNTDSLSFLYYTDTRDRRPTTTFDVNHDGKNRLQDLDDAFFFCKLRRIPNATR